MRSRIATTTTTITDADYARGVPDQQDISGGENKKLSAKHCSGNLVMDILALVALSLPIETISATILDGT